MKNSRPNRIRRAVVGASAALMVTAASTLGFGAYSYLKPTAAASGPVSAVPLTSMTVNLTDSSTESAEITGASVYDIQSTTSTASFIVDEVLRGAPYTVVGTTSQVAGQFSFSADNPSAAQLGTIVVDARTLTTDDASRTRALGNQILDSNQYEYITFTPSQLTGLPATVADGQPFTFQASGDLTIKDVTRPVTFDVTVTPSSDGTMQGTASTTIQYADWGVSIPSVPFVASVDPQVVLQLQFNGVTANA
jgi:polyisoprenoid-binding protein YceI